MQRNATQEGEQKTSIPSHMGPVHRARGCTVAAQACTTAADCGSGAFPACWNCASGSSGKGACVRLGPTTSCTVNGVIGYCVGDPGKPECAVSPCKTFLHLVPAVTQQWDVGRHWQLVCKYLHNLHPPTHHWHATEWQVC